MSCAFMLRDSIFFVWKLTPIPILFRSLVFNSSLVRYFTVLPIILNSLAERYVFQYQKLLSPSFADGITQINNMKMPWLLFFYCLSRKSIIDGTLVQL